MSKLIWIKVYEKLEAELGREPSPEEVDDVYVDHIASMIDRAKNIKKYGE